MIYKGSYTISASSDNHAENHSRRAYTPFSAEASLTKRNIVIYDCGDDRTHFNDFFIDAIREYNAKQKRADRKKDLDYLKALEDGREGYGAGNRKEKPFYHDVIQIGDHITNGVTDDSFDVNFWRELKKQNKADEAAAYVASHLPKPGTEKYNKQQELVGILKEIAEEIRDNKDGNYNNILVHGLTIHFDEPNGTPHLDFRYSIFTDNEKSGLRKRVSMNKGLKNMGYVYTKAEPAIVKFRDDIKKRIERKMADSGFGRELKNEHRRHLSTAAYELEKRAEAAEIRYAEAEKKRKEIEAEKNKADEMLKTAIEVRKILEALVLQVKNELAQQDYIKKMSEIEIPAMTTGDNKVKDEKNDTETNHRTVTPNGKTVMTPEEFVRKYEDGTDGDSDKILTQVAKGLSGTGYINKDNPVNKTVLK